MQKCCDDKANTNSETLIVNTWNASICTAATFGLVKRLAKQDLLMKRRLNLKSRTEPKLENASQNVGKRRRLKLFIAVSDLLVIVMSNLNQTSESNNDINVDPLAMNPLIDEMYEHFRHNVYVGEVVYATLRTGSRAVLGKIIEKIPINTPNGTVIESLSASGDVATTPIKSTTSSSASTPSTSRAVKQEDTSDKDHPFMYKVHLLNRNLDLMSENESDGEEKQDSGSARPAATRAANRQLVHVLAFRNISRDRTILSKTLFKKFIKEYATREQYNNAPWAVRQDVIKLYGITKTLSASQIAEIERKKNVGFIVSSLVFKFNRY